MRIHSWVGFSGKAYSFEVYPSTLKFKPVSGVYLLCEETPEGKIEAFFAGETKSFHDCFNQNAVHEGFSHVALLQCAVPIERHRIHNDLRQAFNEEAKL